LRARGREYKNQELSLIVAAIAIWSYRETLDRYWRADRLLKRFGFGCQ